MRKMFSEKQIKEMIETGTTPESIVSKLANQDVKAKTLEQAEANWSANISEFPNITGGTPSVIFGRVQQLNQSLHIIMVGKIENETEETISGYGTSGINIELPQAIAEKIYDVLGKKASESSSNVRISCALSTTFKNTTSVDMSKVVNNTLMSVMNSDIANTILIRFNSPTSLSLAPDDVIYFDSRIELDLI